VTGAPVTDRRLARALEALGIDPVDVEVVEGNPPWRPKPATFKVVTTAGDVVKIRIMGSAGRAERMARFTAGLADERLPAPVARVGKVTVERWVDGVVLASMPLTDGHLDAAADLLATIHRYAPAPAPAAGSRLPRRRPVRPLLAQARQQLVDLAAARTLTIADVRRAEAILGGLPESSGWGLIHTDLCADNLVARPDGVLVCVDNEFMMRGYRELGLARTWYRWPMPARAWARFERRYRAALGDGARVPPEQARAWRVAATVRGVHLRQQRDAPLDHAVAALRRLTGPPNRRQ
jgi:hypothetical protein